MAAGEGTRMRSSVPKVLHPVCGRPMVAWVVLAAQAAGAGRVAVIVSPHHDIDAALPEGTETVVQAEADGTGGAVRAALDLVRDASTVVVLNDSDGHADKRTRAILAEQFAGQGQAVVEVPFDGQGLRDTPAVHAISPSSPATSGHGRTFPAGAASSCCNWWSTETS